jgi:hypothetical protein
MSERDPIDHLAEALFAAGRRERPLRELRARVLEESRLVERTAVGTEHPEVPPRGARRFARPMYVAMALAAAALVAMLLVHARREVTVAIGPEAPSARERHAAPTPLPATAEPSAPVVSVPERTVQRSAPARDVVPRKPLAPPPVASAPPPVASAPPRPPATLSEEVTALDRARSALNGGDPAAALHALDDYDQVLHGTHLSEEATLLRIEALSRSGHADIAASLARQFIRTNPGSPLAERARGFAGKSGEVQVDAGGMK